MNSPIAGFIAPSKRQRLLLPKVVCQLLEAYGVDLESDTLVDFQIQIPNDGWMPLTITIEAKDVTIEHTNGVGLPDPRATLVADEHGILTVTGFNMLWPNPRVFRPGRAPEFERMVRLRSPQVWAQNIRSQGFLDAARALGREHRGHLL